jgi:hypothetical protein
LSLVRATGMNSGRGRGKRKNRSRVISCGSEKDMARERDKGMSWAFAEVHVKARS